MTKRILMRKESGSALPLVLITSVVLLTATVCAFQHTLGLARNVERSNTMRQALNIGDGALEYAFGYWREVCRQRSNIPRPGNDFASPPLPTAAMFNLVANYTATRTEHPTAVLSNYRIEAVDPQYRALPGDAKPVSATGMSIGNYSICYRASADVRLPTINGTLNVKLRRIFEKQTISPWNYAIFYVDDLEIHPGPAFAITGWVHSNARVFTGHASLRFDTKMTYGDDWTIGFMPQESAHTGTAPTAPTWPSNQPPTREQGQQPYGLDSQRIFSTTDSSLNNDSYREIVEQRSGTGVDPFTDLTDPDNPRKARYYDQADLKILVAGNGAVTIRDASNTVLTAASTGDAKKMYDVAVSALSTGQTIQDNREAAQVRLTTLDISKFHDAMKVGGFMENVSCGVIYISDTSAAGLPANQRRAIRLKNGSHIPPGGLTIASDNGVYIQGDYNTGSTAVLKPLSNHSSAPEPLKSTVPGYAKQPCAVVADAVMVLSNQWQDGNSSLDVSQRRATPTTYNTAIISGVVPSGTIGSNYSGGAENFPRFMENWDSVNMTYHGSMVQLYKSKFHTGAWGKGNVYGAPRRNWFFETLFYTDPPPGTLDLILYKRGHWYIES